MTGLDPIGEIPDLNTAFKLHQEGRLEPARSMYLQVLARDPANADALHLLGVLAYQSGELEQAVRYFRGALQVRPAEALVHYNLAVALEDLRRADQAEAEYKAALEADPDLVQAHNNLGNLLSKKRLVREAEHHYREAIRLLPAEAGYHANLGRLLQDDPSRRAEALAAFREALRLDPSDAAARYVAAALSGEDAPSTAPASYITSLFDGYADRFEQELTQTLSYRVPSMLGERLARLRPAGSLDVLDLGCGTGLCGVELRTLARSLTGVDLSPKMIEKSRERGVYDALIQGELMQVLGTSEARYDLVIAADVLIYLGDPVPLFKAACSALRPAGLLAISVEHHDGPPAYRLNPTGRYSHAADSIRQLGLDTGYAELLAEPVVVRTQHKLPVPGHLFIFGKAPASPAPGAQGQQSSGQTGSWPQPGASGRCQKE
jgi:predicted TPR repeat methyltransferase